MTNWINTVSRDHVERGVQGRFTQANHGKPNMLRKMARGDWIVFYSPKTHFPSGEPSQAFTAIGQVGDDEAYQADSRHPDVVFADAIEADLSRRDFTVNAMALSLPDLQLVDPFDGIGDLGRGHVHATR